MDFENNDYRSYQYYRHAEYCWNFVRTFCCDYSSLWGWIGRSFSNTTHGRILWRVSWTVTGRNSHWNSGSSRWYYYHHRLLLLKSSKKKVNTALTSKELFQRGSNIGNEHLLSMLNTLVLAFTQEPHCHFFSSSLEQCPYGQFWIWKYFLKKLFERLSEALPFSLVSRSPMLLLHFGMEKRKYCIIFILCYIIKWNEYFKIKMKRK